MEGYKTPPTPPITGPGSIGHLATIAIGAYTEIVDIIAPEEADAGDLVTVKVKVENLHSDELAVMVGGYLDDTEIWFSPEYAWLDPGEIYTFTYKFTMPNNAVHIHVWSYYWTGEEWYGDDYGYVEIALAGVPEPYKGTISKMELEYNSARAAIPVSNIPQGQRGLIHIWGRNDMSTSQKLGISWRVKDPDGVVVEEYSDWQAFSTGPSDEHEFIGGRFNLDKVGTYTIYAGLVMNFDAPVYVDTYDGDLCTVAAAVPEPPFTEITEIVAPSSAVAGETVNIEVKVKNLATYAITITVTGRVDGLDLDFGDIYYSVPAGGTQSFYDAFIMPSRSVTITAWSWYKIDGWPTDPDDEAEKVVSLEEVEVYAGTIIGIELEHDGAQEGLPVYNIPQGQTARVHVWGRNDMSTVQRLGIHWIVRDPDGEVVEDYDDWSFLGYRQGADHEFKGGYFNLAKVGTYTIDIALSMNPADPVIVDDHSGTLCTVAAVVPEPEFAGFGITEYTKR